MVDLSNQYCINCINKNNTQKCLMCDDEWNKFSPIENSRLKPIWYQEIEDLKKDIDK